MGRLLVIGAFSVLVFADVVALLHWNSPVREETVRVPRYADTIQADPLVREFACGPLSLIAVLSHLGLSLPPDEQERLVRVAGEEGTTFHQLKAEAERLGVHALGVEIPLEQLKELRLPAIVQLDQFTFAAALAYGRDGVALVYPMSRAVYESDDVFTRKFGDRGKALLLSRSPLAPEALGFTSTQDAGGRNSDTPPLQVFPPVVAVGMIHSPEWRKSVSLLNTSDQVIHIEQVQPSCSCMRATVDAQAIAPKGSVTLTVNGRQDTANSFLFKIDVRTNAPGQPLVTIPVRGVAEPPVSVSSSIVQLKGVVNGDVVERDVPVIIHGDLDISEIRIEIPENARVAATPLRLADGRAVIRVMATPTLVPGHWEIPLLFGHVGKTGEDDLVHNLTGFPTRMIVSFDVAALVDYHPKSLLIGKDEFNSDWSRKIALHLNESLVNQGIRNVDVAVDWADGSQFGLLPNS